MKKLLFILKRLTIFKHLDFELLELLLPWNKLEVTLDTETRKDNLVRDN